MKIYFFNYVADVAAAEVDGKQPAGDLHRCAVGRRVPVDEDLVAAGIGIEEPKDHLVIAFERRLDDSERECIEAYLAEKYGIRCRRQWK